MPKPRTCRHCRFFQEINGASGQLGECRAQPPVKVNASQRGFPLTEKEDWCGWWQDVNDPKPEYRATYGTDE